MVHAKKRSGDPDYDDKVPMDEQLHETVTDDQGNEVYLTDNVGPIRPDGSHANLDVSAEDLDNRPAPGGVAKESSTVQTYDASDDKAKASKSPNAKK